MRAILDRYVNDIEFNQAFFRIFFLLCVLPYIYVVSGYDFGNFYNLSIFYSAAIGYCSATFIIAYIVYRWPGKMQWRRVSYVFLDVSAACYALSGGGAYSLPVYAALTSAIMGFGIRFGTKYLFLAVCTALAGLILTISANTFLRENPFVSAALIATILAIPSYAVIINSRLRRALDDARTADIDKSRFLARASHDLRQPIHAIGLLSAQLSQSSLDSKQQELVSKIENSVEGASGMFQSLLDISMIDSGGLEPHVSSTQLGRLLEDIERENSVEAERRNTKIRIVRTNHVVETDAVLLKVMAQNILTNALKYAADGEILIGCRRRGNSLSLWVCDQGKGIPPEELSYIVDEFYRGHTNSKNNPEGSGLGLSIVKKLADLLGLAVKIESEMGKGTLVSVDGIKLGTRQSLKQPAIQSVPSLQLSGLKILLADDDETSLNATATLLLQWGCDVNAYTQVSDDLLKDYSRYDVIISDYDFGSDHLLSDHLGILREAISNQVSIIVVTGHSEDKIDHEMGLKDVAIFSKPLKAADLRSLLMAKKTQRRVEET